MAKRFSSTEKWDDVWFSELSPIGKLLFLFIVDKCNNAGFIEPNCRLHSFTMGITKEQYDNGIVESEKVIVYSKTKNVIWIKTFLLHQNNLPLNGENNAHKQIINLIRSNEDLFNFDFNDLAPQQGLFRGLGKGIGNGNGIGIGNNLISINPLYYQLNKLEEILINETTWQESICRDNKLSLSAVKDWIKKFILKLQSDGEDGKSLKDAKKHFNNWLKIELNKVPKKIPAQKSFQKQ